LTTDPNIFSIQHCPSYILQHGRNIPNVLLCAHRLCDVARELHTRCHVKTADLFASVFVCYGQELIAVCRYFCSTKLRYTLSPCLYFMTIRVVNDIINCDAVCYFVVMMRVIYTREVRITICHLLQHE